MNVSIQKVDVADVADIIFSIVKRSFIRDFDPPTKDVDVVKSYLKDCLVYLVCDEKTPIGYFGYERTSPYSYDLKSIALLPEYQGKKIGSQMLQKVINLTKGNVISLVVHPSNTSAILSYFKNGFSISGWKENFFGDGKPRLLMETK